nr:multiple organellar rna editing factor 5, mitochondrial [Quercus suber]
MDKPGIGVVTKAQMVDYYAQILTKVLGNEKDAQMCIYHVSWQSNFGFCCELDNECARELAGVPGVLSVQLDKNFESENKYYGVVKLDKTNLNAGDARTNASAVEVKSKIDTGAAKGKTTISKAEHEVTCHPGIATESGLVQCPISKAQSEQLLAFLNASCNSGENHHAANVSTGNGLDNLVSGAVDVCSFAGVPATAGVAATNPHPQVYNNYLETMLGNDSFVTPITIQDESIACSNLVPDPIPVQVSSLHSDSSHAAFDSTDFSVPSLPMTNASAVEDESKIDTNAVKGKTMISKAEHERPIPNESFQRHSDYIFSLPLQQFFPLEIKQAAFSGNNLQSSTDLPDPSEASQTTPMKTKKLFVTWLSFYTSEKTLRAAFEGFGELVEVKIIMDTISKRSKGYAFIEYTTEEAASAALKEMNGKIINGWMIVVDVAKTNPPRYSRGRPR